MHLANVSGSLSRSIPLPSLSLFDTAAYDQMGRQRDRNARKKYLSTKIDRTTEPEDYGALNIHEGRHGQCRRFALHFDTPRLSVK